MDPTTFKEYLESRLDDKNQKRNLEFLYSLAERFLIGINNYISISKSSQPNEQLYRGYRECFKKALSTVELLRKITDLSDEFKHADALCDMLIKIDVGVAQRYNRAVRSIESKEKNLKSVILE